MTNNVFAVLYVVVAARMCGRAFWPWQKITADLVQRRHKLAPMLRENPDVTEMNEVLDTAVPVIKMKFQGIDIDLLFACISSMKVGKDMENLDDNNIFRGLDTASIRSLKGRRDTDMIDKLVPEKDTFKLTLRCIKLWAKNRGIYSNVLGYIGGVTWAMLVAKVCIDNPGKPTYLMLKTFFEYYASY